MIQRDLCAHCGDPVYFQTAYTRQHPRGRWYHDNMHAECHPGGTYATPHGEQKVLV